MKPSNLSRLTVLFFSGLTIVFFQNCSKVAVNDAPGTQNKVTENIARATNQEGQEVPVMVTPAADAIDEDQPKNPDVDPVAETPVQDPVVDPPAVPSEEMSSACGLDLKTIHNIVDLAQFKGQDVTLDLLQGKTLIYSSDPQITLKSLNIESAVGRTILCGCKVDKLDVKKGRLEVYHSEIKEIGSQKGKLISDSSSLLPAGF